MLTPPEIALRLASERVVRELRERQLIQEVHDARPPRTPIRLAIGRRLIDLGSRLVAETPRAASDVEFGLPAPSCVGTMRGR